MNKNILNFIKDYYLDYNGLIENYIQNSSGNEKQAHELKDKLFEDLINLKKSIPEKLQSYNIDEKDINSKLKQNKQVISLIQNIYTKYDLILSEGVSKNIFATTILGTQEINQAEVKKYIKRINNYTNNQLINNLYDLAFLNNEESDKTNLKSAFAKFFKESLVKLKTYEKAELYSQLNVFIEEYTKTSLGKKHIEILHAQYLKDIKSESNKIDKNYAVKNWMINVLSAYNSCTPTENNILVDNEEIKIKTAKGGTFDALLFINTTPVPEDRKEEFNSIKTIKELESFKSSISNISQFQISATSDKGFNIESSSVVKHCLSSLVINKILNLHWILKAEDNFIDLFSMNNNGSSKFNQEIKGAITQAIKETCPELVYYLFKDKKDIEDEDFFIKIQQKMNENPLLFIDYLKNKYDYLKTGQDLIKENISLNHEDINIFNNLEKKYEYIKNRSPIFKNKSLLCLFRMEEAYTNVSFDIEIKIPLYLRNQIKKQELSTNDVVLLIQFNSIVKSSYFGSESADNKSIIKIIDNFFDIRGIGLKNKYNNELLEKFRIEDIDQLILNNFVYGKNSLSNLKQLNKQDMENTVQCIVMYFHSAKDDERQKIFEKLKEYSPDIKYLRDSLNKGKSIEQITDIYEKVNEIKELNKKIKEKDLIIDRERQEKEKLQEELKEKSIKEIKNIINIVLETKIASLLENQLKNLKDSFYLLSLKEIQDLQEILYPEKELIIIFNDFLKENDLLPIETDNLLNENFNNNNKASEVVFEIEKFINNKFNKKELKSDSTTRLENLFLSFETKIENKEILEMIKNSIEEYKEQYPQIWKKLHSIDFENSINKRVLKNN